MFKKLGKILGGDPTKRALDEIAQTVDEINALENTYEQLSDDALRAKTAEFRQRLKDGETLDDILVEAFAVVREVSKRTIGLRHYDVQMIGGIALHDGKIAEMRTGEGKTLVATLPVYLNALTGRGVHLITVNDYLARRDARWMAPIYQLPRADRRRAANGCPHRERPQSLPDRPGKDLRPGRPAPAGHGLPPRGLPGRYRPTAPTANLALTICAITSPCSLKNASSAVIIMHHR